MNKTELAKLIGHKNGHKYHAKAQKCNLGHLHPSKAEAMHCWALQAQIKAGQIGNLTWQKPYPLFVGQQLIYTHRPDFTYYKMYNGVLRTCVDEVKGMPTADWQIVSKLFQALYQDIIYRVVT